MAIYNGLGLLVFLAGFLGPAGPVHAEDDNPLMKWMRVEFPHELPEGSFGEILVVFPDREKVKSGTHLLLGAVARTALPERPKGMWRVEMRITMGKKPIGGGGSTGAGGHKTKDGTAVGVATKELPLGEHAFTVTLFITKPNGLPTPIAKRDGRFTLVKE